MVSCYDIRTVSGVVIKGLDEDKELAIELAFGEDSPFYFCAVSSQMP